MAFMWRRGVSVIILGGAQQGSRFVGQRLVPNFLYRGVRFFEGVDVGRGKNL